jgi:hypothetical protein
VVGHLSARDSIKGTLREGSFTGEPGRGSFAGTKKSISGFLSWTWRPLRF